ncbi:uncharacterized protein N7506_012326, partial [Penicillium brevicompactum]|uniref:uncharacterized protein n=1 Tax=Penicillium brevicompactum TaxID=5074 RepID=UPI002541043B
MEPASFAIGLVGLVSLFNTSLDILDKFDSWRDCEDESQALIARFKAHKLQLERWGQAVGIENGIMSAKHDKLLDDSRTLRTVQDLLSAIVYICGPDEPPHIPLDSKRQKLNWTLRAKKKRTTQVEQFASIVEILHSLVPIEKDGVSRYDDSFQRANSSRHMNNAFQSHGDWVTDMKRILSNIESEIEVETRRDLQKWLLGNYLPNDRYETYKEKRLDGTCEWIISQPWFRDWSSPDFPKGSAKILWINGPAGFGKTVLCTKIIDHMSSIAKGPLGHFFFSADFERHDPFTVIRLWVSQVVSHPIAFKLAREMWAIQQGPNATRTDLMKLLRAIVTAVPGCTFVVDGLDECTWQKEHQQTGGNETISGFMEALRKITEGATTRLMITSRDEPEIRNLLSVHAHHCLMTEHKITSEDVQIDVASYSRKIVYQELKKSTEAAKNTLTQKLAERCSGQFLWVTMQQESLRRNSWRSQKEIERTINTTPKGLERVYEQNWIKILELPEEDRGRSLSLLRWTAFSQRPLTVNEITEALLICETRDEVRIDELPEVIDMDYIENGISYYCGSLLEIRGPQEESEDGVKTVHLAHFSVKQYLLHKASRARLLHLNGALGYFAESTENTLLAKMCLRYVNFLATRRKGPRIEHDRFRGFFLDYAAGSWQQHACIGEAKDGELISYTNRLFDIKGPSWTAMREWLDRDYTEGGRKQSGIEHNPAGPVYYAALLGLVDTLSFLMNERKHSADETGPLILLEKGADLTIVNNDRWTPVNIASSNGHLEVVKLLLEKGADPKTANNAGWTPVNSASEHGHHKIIKLLLEKRADAKTASNNGWTPVNIASSNGHLEVVKLLLEKGADPKTTNNAEWTPVNSTSEHGHHEIIKLLLEKRVDLTIANNDEWTPVNTTSQNGHLEVVKLILKKETDLAIASNNRWTPVNITLLNGHLKVVKFLLEREADPKTANNTRWTPVNIASQNGHLEVVKLLLENGADPTVASNNGTTPVHTASLNDHFKLVQLLLEEGVNIGIPDIDGLVPLYSASVDGHLEVVNLLLNHEADSRVTDNDGYTPLYTTAQNGSLEILKLLLVHKASFMTRHKGGCTPLYTASDNGHLEVVKLLLEEGADATVVNDNGWISLNSASWNGHLEVVKLLLEKGADPKTANNVGWTLVNSASEHGHHKIIKLLLEKGADPKTASNDGWTLVNIASQNGHLEVVKLLLERGTDIMTRSKNGRTPIYSASANGHLEVVNLLLENGAKSHDHDVRLSMPLHVASANGHLKVVKRLLRSSGTKIDTCDDCGRTPLFLAAARGHSDLVHLLISQDALMNMQDRYMSTPLCSAIRNGHEDVVRLLLPFAKTAAGFEDALGKNLVWWANKTGNVNIIEIVDQWAQKMNIKIHENDLASQNAVAPSRRLSR